MLLVEAYFSGQNATLLKLRRSQSEVELWKVTKASLKYLGGLDISFE
jgi:hypothetical protein